MNVLHRDVLDRLLEFIPDVRAFSCVCKWSRDELAEHPDMLYWRAGADTRERYLTTKIYAEFKCANVYNLIKYDRADLFTAHCGDKGGTAYRDYMIEYDARKIIEACYNPGEETLPIHHHISKIKTGEQFRYLKSQFDVVGTATAVYETICAGNADLAAEMGAGSPETRERVVSHALMYGSPAIVERLVVDGVIDRSRVHQWAVERSNYGLFDMLYRTGSTMAVPEDLVDKVIVELSPAGLTAFAAVQDIRDNLNNMFDILLTSTLKLVPTAFRLGAAPTPENTADYINYAAKCGDLGALLALRSYSQTRV